MKDDDFRAGVEAALDRLEHGCAIPGTTHDMMRDIVADVRSALLPPPETVADVLADLEAHIGIRYTARLVEWTDLESLLDRLADAYDRERAARDSGGASGAAHGNDAGGPSSPSTPPVALAGDLDPDEERPDLPALGSGTGWRHTDTGDGCPLWNCWPGDSHATYDDSAVHRIKPGAACWSHHADGDIQCVRHAPPEALATLPPKPVAPLTAELEAVVEACRAIVRLFTAAPFSEWEADYPTAVRAAQTALCALDARAGKDGGQ